MPSANVPLFNWLQTRSAGLLLHPTSFPGNQGVGVLETSQVTALFEFMNAAGLSQWQTCPLGPTGFGDSPYQCFSSFAGNPYLVDLQPLVAAGLLTRADLIPLQSLPHETVDYGLLYEQKWPILFKAYQNWKASDRDFQPYGKVTQFEETHADWLDGYAHFMAFKEHFQGAAWQTWPADVRFEAKARKSKLWNDAHLAETAAAHAFFQYLFYGQWDQVRKLAVIHGIEIIGDVPIFVAGDSADVWGNPQLFQIDQKTGAPLHVAGVPPDYFSADGQLWGNPLYAWDVHRAENYAWWLNRLRANLALADIVRIDHFRGFDTYWSIPSDAPTAKTGQWRQGPGLDFFKVVEKHLPDCRLIAEDLGELSPSVIALRDATGLPGMAILQFAFGGDSQNLYLPHNLRPNSIIYPGTHDNDTSLGWYRSVDDLTRDHVNRYLRVSGENIGWDLIRAAYGSVSAMAITPLQDLLSLGSAARLNTPGKAAGNWQWRYHENDLSEMLSNSANYLAELAELSSRSPATTRID